ncbi:putative D-alanyl-D-alanine carboxypeptidase [[Synechococcus] sp. NIES-970]|uniref:M15 family metallopeptidase n=1 Tax=Picosynechococcus sp. NKBG15041c TaxID=1407650 RepID=UPI000467BA6D|nr:M15 family metallopeptidase [Picosynechococcus sp. NKBG15041c]BAW96663.1 putative D-alanyl-D-alanine carboxypeptidase [[Synechococcus] sp. NIES-970]
MSEELNDLSVLDEMDIPEVLRDEHPDFSKKPKIKPTTKRLLFRLGAFLFGLVAFVILGLGAIATRQMFTAAPEPTAREAISPPETTGNGAAPEAQILGHFLYPEAAPSDLVPVSADGRFQLRPAAAEKFLQMQADASSAGINLVLISAFRSIEEQRHLFFDVKEQRAQDTSQRAEVSAPPNYSEHHTGYAIDIGDGNAPDTHLQENFEDTAAFQWLQANAARYSFELSFPRNNLQGIAYEPWHWRFVGDQDSLETFYRARNFNQ